MPDNPKDPPKPARKRAAGRAQIASVSVIPRDKAAQGRNAPRNSEGLPKKIAEKERRARALTLRRAGLTYEQVAEEIRAAYPELRSYTKQRAHDDVKVLLDGLSLTPARGLLEEELDRLLAMQVALWSRAMNGQLGAVDRILRIMERRSKYLGLDAPIQQMLIGPDGSPVGVAFEDPAAVMASAIRALATVLPYREPPALPGATG